MKKLTKDILEKKVYWVIADIDGGEVQSGTYAQMLSDKADCLDLPDVPEIVDRVIDGQRVWDVMAGKDLIVRCETEEEAEMERLEYLDRASIDCSGMIFDLEHHAKLYHAVMNGEIDCEEDLLEVIDELVVDRANIML